VTVKTNLIVDTQIFPHAVSFLVLKLPGQSCSFGLCAGHVDLPPAMGEGSVGGNHAME